MDKLTGSLISAPQAVTRRFALVGAVPVVSMTGTAEANLTASFGCQTSVSVKAKVEAKMTALKKYITSILLGGVLLGRSGTPCRCEAAWWVEARVLSDERAR